MATVKFWQGMDKASNIVGADKMMIGKNETGEAQYVDFQDANQFLSIQGVEMKPVPAGALPAGPAGQTRTMEILEAGTWTYGGNSFVNPSGSIMKLWWDGTTWSLGSSIPMPKQDVIDNLTTDSSQDALSAKQGRNLELKKLDTEDLPNQLFENVGALADDDNDSFTLTDFEGNVAFEVKADGTVNYNGKFSEETIPPEFENRGLLAIDDEKFAIADNNGNVIFLAEKGKVDFIGKIVGQNQSSLNKIGALDNSTITITDFTRHSKKGIIISVFCNLSNLSSGSITIGFGKQTYRGRYIEINASSVIPKKFESSETSESPIAHNLVIDSFLSISLYVDDSGKGLLLLTSKSGNSKLSLDWGYETNYDPFLMASNVSLSNVKMNLSNKDFKKPIWVFTDSYGGIAANRWPGIMRGFGFFNFYLNGLAGQSSLGALNDFKKSLKYGIPKYLFWCLGMNDSDANYQAALTELKGICIAKDIQLILSTIPTVPGRSKELISQTVRDSGYRYVDFYKAVGADANGDWYSGMLYSDLVHPTDLGAKALASQVLIDFPEIMQEGIVSTTSEIGNISGDN